MLGALALGVDPASRFSLVGADATSTPDFKSLRVKDLQNELKALGLPTSGRKAELIERLQSACEPADAESDGVGEGGGPIRDKLVSPRHPIPHPQFPFFLSLYTH